MIKLTVCFLHYDCSTPFLRKCAKILPVLMLARRPLWETLRWSDRLAKLSTLAKPAVIYPRTRSWNTRLHIDTNTQQQGLKLLHPLLQSVILGLELLVALLELTEPLLLPLPRLASSQRIL